MHELGLTQEIVALIVDRVPTAKVRRVVLEIGKLSAVLPDAIRFCFDLCSQDTVLEGAELEIIEVPGRVRCLDCGTEMALDQPYGVCACGSPCLQVLAGEELKVKAVEVACDV